MTDASELDMYHDLPNVDFATLHGFDGRRLLEITRSRLSQSADLPRQDVRGVSIATPLSDNRIRDFRRHLRARGQPEVSVVVSL